MKENGSSGLKQPIQETGDGGKVLSLIMPYVAMGMMTREIELAVAIDHKKIISYSTVLQTIRDLRKSGEIPKQLAQVENRGSKNDFSTGDNIFKERVISWVVAKHLLEKGETQVPNGRAGWMEVIDTMKNNSPEGSLHKVALLLNRGATVADSVEISKLE